MKRVTYATNAEYGSVLISIHTLCEEGDPIIDWSDEDVWISIHTLCEEGDGLTMC